MIAARYAVGLDLHGRRTDLHVDRRSDFLGRRTEVHLDSPPVEVMVAIGDYDSLIECNASEWSSSGGDTYYVYLRYLLCTSTATPSSGVHSEYGCLLWS